MKVWPWVGVTALAMPDLPQPPCCKQTGGLRSRRTQAEPGLPLMKTHLSLSVLPPGPAKHSSQVWVSQSHYFFRFSFASFLLFISLFFNFLLCLGSCFVSNFLFLSLFKLTMEAFCPALLKASFHSSSSPRIMY